MLNVQNRQALLIVQGNDNLNASGFTEHVLFPIGNQSVELTFSRIIPVANTFAAQIRDNRVSCDLLLQNVH